MPQTTSTSSSHLHNAPWTPSTVVDVGAGLPDGLYVAYVRMAVEMPTHYTTRPHRSTRPRQAVVWVHAGVALLIVLKDAAYMQQHNQVLLVMLTPLRLQGGGQPPLPRTMDELHAAIGPWFASRPQWWRQYHLPRAFDVMLHEWKSHHAQPDETLAYSLRLIASALGYKNPLPATRPGGKAQWLRIPRGSERSKSSSSSSCSSSSSINDSKAIVPPVSTRVCEII